MNLWGFWAQNYTYKTHTRYEKPIIILRPTIKTEKYDMQGHMVILRPKEGIELLLYCFVLTELTCACSCTHTHTEASNTFNQQHFVPISLILKDIYINVCGSIADLTSKQII